MAHGHRERPEVDVCHHGPAGDGEEDAGGRRLDPEDTTVHTVSTR
ncbi:hypothetical protein [Streptomyces sp. NPDC049585]